MNLFHKPDDPAADVVDDGVYLTLEPPEPAPISLVTLAAELDEHPGALAHRLGAEVFVEPATGLRCVTVATCRRLTDDRRELHEEIARRAAEAAARHRPTPLPNGTDPIAANYANVGMERAR